MMHAASAVTSATPFPVWAAVPESPQDLGSGWDAEDSHVVGLAESRLLA